MGPMDLNSAHSLKSHHLLNEFEGQGHSSKVNVTILKSKKYKFQPCIRKKGGPHSRSQRSRSCVKVKGRKGQGQSCWWSFLPY